MELAKGWEKVLEASGCVKHGYLFPFEESLEGEGRKHRLPWETIA